jgi:hypothetical protein
MKEKLDGEQRSHILRALSSDITAALNDYLERYDLTTVDVVGILEITKLTFYKVLDEEDEEDEDGNEDSNDL